MQLYCKKNMRTNTYSEKIIDVLSQHHLKTIGDINDLIPEADYSTIFRNIKALVKDGTVRSLTLDDAKVFYELADAHKHDHFLCTDCGDVTVTKQVAHQMQDVIPKGHKVFDIIMRGICKKCA